MPNGRLVLVFDDGYTEDHDEVLPVLRSAAVPACFAVISGEIGSSGNLTTDQLDALVAAGSEIAVHGRKHRRLQALELDRDVTPGDDRLHVTGNVFPAESHGVLIGDSLQVIGEGGDDVVEVEAIGVEDGTEYLDLGGEIDGSYEAGGTLVRPTEDLLETEIVGGRGDLEALGHDATTFVFPYDAADVRAWSLARRHYDVVPNASVRSLPNLPGTPLTTLRRWYLETDHLTRVEIGEYLDEVVETGGLGILAGHSAWATVTPERVEWVIEAARSRGVELTTFRELVADGELVV